MSLRSFRVFPSFNANIVCLFSTYPRSLRRQPNFLQREGAWRRIPRSLSGFSLTVSRRAFWNLGTHVSQILKRHPFHCHPRGERPCCSSSFHLCFVSSDLFQTSTRGTCFAWFPAQFDGIDFAARPPDINTFRQTMEVRNDNGIRARSECALALKVRRWQTLSRSNNVLRRKKRS